MEDILAPQKFKEIAEHTDFFNSSIAFKANNLFK